MKVTLTSCFIGDFIGPFPLVPPRMASAVRGCAVDSGSAFNVSKQSRWAMPIGKGAVVGMGWPNPAAPMLPNPPSPYTGLPHPGARVHSRLAISGISSGEEGPEFLVPPPPAIADAAPNTIVGLSVSTRINTICKAGVPYASAQRTPNYYGRVVEKRDAPILYEQPIRRKTGIT